MFENWRFNPFTETMNSVLVEDEEHTIAYHADWNGYGIQLHEAPQLDNPSTVSIVEDVTGGATFSEVPRTQNPEAGQYRVDYAASTYYGTGRIQFNAADVGKTVLVTYYGTGWTVKNNYRQGQTTIPTNLEVEEDAAIHGDLALDGENTGGGNLHVAGNADVDGDLNVGGTITGDVTGNVTGDVTGNVTGDVTGNADTATQADGIKETGSGSCVVHKKIIEIGDWNMDTTQNVDIAHGLTLSKIRRVMVLIRNDADSVYYPLEYSAGANYPCGFYNAGTSTIFLSRITGQYFDSASFDSTSYNRGWIVIEYVD